MLVFQIHYFRPAGRIKKPAAVPRKIDPKTAKLVQELYAVSGDRRLSDLLAARILKQPDPEKTKKAVLAELQRLAELPKKIRSIVTRTLRHPVICDSFVKDPKNVMKKRIKRVTKPHEDRLFAELRPYCPDNDARAVIAQQIVRHPNPEKAKKAVIAALERFHEPRKDLTLEFLALRYENIAKAFVRNPDLILKALQEGSLKLRKQDIAFTSRIFYTLNSPLLAASYASDPKRFLPMLDGLQILGEGMEIVGEDDLSRTKAVAAAFKLLQTKAVAEAFARNPKKVAESLVHLYEVFSTYKGILKDEYRYTVITRLFELLQDEKLARFFLADPHGNTERLFMLAGRHGSFSTSVVRDLSRLRYLVMPIPGVMTMPPIDFTFGEEVLINLLANKVIADTFVTDPARVISKVTRILQLNAATTIPPFRQLNSNILARFFMALESPELAKKFLEEPSISPIGVETSVFMRFARRLEAAGDDTLGTASYALRAPAIQRMLASDEKRLIGYFIKIIQQPGVNGLILLGNHRIAEAFEKNPDKVIRTLRRIARMLDKFDFSDETDSRFFEHDYHADAYILISQSLEGLFLTKPGKLSASFSRIASLPFAKRSLSILSTDPVFYELYTKKPSMFLQLVRYSYEKDLLIPDLIPLARKFLES